MIIMQFIVVNNNVAIFICHSPSVRVTRVKLRIFLLRQSQIAIALSRNYILNYVDYIFKQKSESFFSHRRN